MRILGAVLAGGQSRRFGSDKAMALLAGRPLIAHAIDRLARHSDAWVVCGRQDAAWRCLNDRPRGGLGPLGGLNAALAYARTAGFDAVLSVPCDAPGLPDEVFDALRLAGGAACLADLPVAGIWPSRLAPMLDDFLRESEDRSLRAWARCAAAATIAGTAPVANINTPEDLTRAAK